MTERDGYDVWRLEGRPEELRWLDELGARVADDEGLSAAGVTTFGWWVDDERGVLVLKVAAPDGDAALRLVRERHGAAPVELEVVAAAAYVVEDVPWERWSLGATDRDLRVHLLDATDGSELEPLLAEEDARVVVTLRGPRWQGVYAAVGIDVTKTVRLAAPLGDRVVVDGATGRARPRRR